MRIARVPSERLHQAQKTGCTSYKKRLQDNQRLSTIFPEEKNLDAGAKYAIPV